MRVRDLLPIGIALIVLGLTLSIGSRVSEDVTASMCEDLGGTYEYYTTNGQLGCCLSINASDSEHCLSFSAGDIAYNVSIASLEGQKTLGDWQDTIALVVAAVVIIGLVIAGFGRRGAE